MPHETAGDNLTPSACSNGESDLPPYLRRVTPEDESRDLSLVSREDVLLAYADTYGFQPPGELADLEAFDRHVARLPPARKAALHRGYTTSQARLFLRIEEGDAGRAAERMARYWERRAGALGEDDAYYTQSSSAGGEPCTPARNEEDFLRIYNMALGAASDPEVDEETRRWAMHYTDTYIRSKFAQLEEELGKKSANEKSSFLAAEKLMPDVVNDAVSRIEFLRCEGFNVSRAARRILRYWDFCFELLGRDDDAFRSITVESLMDEYPGELTSGFVRSLPETDAAGRGILCFSADRFGRQYSVQGMLKVLWYVVHSMLKDEACRINGIIFLNNQKGMQSSAFSWKFSTQASRLLLESMPMSVKAIHECTPKASWFMNAVAPVVKWLIGRKLRLRYCIHTGADEQISSELEEFGIPLEQIPSELGGALDFDSAFDDWLEEQRADEVQVSPAILSTLPHPITSREKDFENIS